MTHVITMRSRLLDQFRMTGSLLGSRGGLLLESAEAYFRTVLYLVTAVDRIAAGKDFDVSTLRAALNADLALSNRSLPSFKAT
ncbi:MAG TPA: hypothetical protein VML19_03755 [Verrucomicrobiae bacterium]|nr:hypothetical protein [Verrucomicrobiae bacterium]